MNHQRKWCVVHYEATTGECPIRTFLDGLGTKERAKILAAVDLLEEEGPNLHRPYTDYLRDGIHELRVRVSRIRYRVLYFFCNRSEIVLTHGITKKTGRVPETEIDRAVRCRKDWLRRQNEDT